MLSILSYEDYNPKGETKPLIKKVKDSFGSRLAIASLELTFNIKYDIDSKVLDLNNVKLDEEVSIKLDRDNKQVATIVANRLKSVAAVDKAIDELRTYTTVDAAYSELADYETDNLTLRELVIIITDVNEAAEKLSGSNPEIIEKLSKFNKLCKYYLIDSKGDDTVITKKKPLIDMLNKLKEL